MSEKMLKTTWMLPSTPKMMIEFEVSEYGTFFIWKCACLIKGLLVLSGLLNAAKLSSTA